jgi:hypothetical protein
VVGGMWVHRPGCGAGGAGHARRVRPPACPPSQFSVLATAPASWGVPPPSLASERTAARRGCGSLSLCSTRVQPHEMMCTAAPLLPVPQVLREHAARDVRVDVPPRRAPTLLPGLLLAAARGAAALHGGLERIASARRLPGTVQHEGRPPVGKQQAAPGAPLCSPGSVAAAHAARSPAAHLPPLRLLAAAPARCLACCPA